MSSVEYATLANCSSELESSLMDLDRGIVLRLCDKRMIRYSVYEEIFSPSSMLTKKGKSGMLVNSIKDEVKDDPESYFVFLDILRQYPKYGTIVLTLNSEHDNIARKFNGRAVANKPFSEHMSIDELCSWLKARQMPEKDIAIIREKDVGGVAFKLLVENQDLETLGISKVGHLIVLRHIKKEISQASPSRGGIDADQISAISNLHPDSLKMEVSDQHLHELADHMTDWEWKLAPRLGLSQSEVEALKSMGHSESVQRIEALKIWKQRCVFKPTYQELLDICRAANHTSCIKAMSHLLKKKRDNVQYKHKSKVLSDLVPEKYEEKFKEIFLTKDHHLKKEVFEAIQSSFSKSRGDLRIGYGYKRLANNERRLCISVELTPFDKYAHEDQSDKERTIEAIVDCTNYKDHFQMESDPHWLKYTINNESSGNSSTDGTDEHGGTLTMLLKIRNGDDSKFYGITCLHVPLPSTPLASQQLPQPSQENSISQQPLQGDFNSQQPPQGQQFPQGDPNGQQPPQDNSNGQQGYPNGHHPSQALNFTGQQPEQEVPVYCMSRNKSYENILRELNLQISESCNCFRVYHKLSSRPLLVQSDLKNIRMKQGDYYPFTLGPMACILYGNCDENGELFQPCSRRKHSKIFHGVNTELVSLSVDKNTVNEDKLVEKDFVEGNTYHLSNNWLVSSNVTADKFVIGDLSYGLNMMHSDDDKYYTFNYRKFTEPFYWAMSKCGMIYLPQEAHEMCTRSVSMLSCEEISVPSNDGSRITYVVRAYTGESDWMSNGRLFGTYGDSGSYVYYIRKEDKARVVVGYMTRAFNHHMEYCFKDAAIDCLQSPVDCFNFTHLECTSSHCHQDRMAECITNPAIIPDTCGKCQFCYDEHINCHRHCVTPGCKYLAEKKEEKWSFVYILPIDSLSVLVSKLCELNEWPTDSSTSITPYFHFRPSNKEELLEPTPQ